LEKHLSCVLKIDVGVLSAGRTVFTGAGAAT